jgi:glutamyl endopeptidase
MTSPQTYLDLISWGSGSGPTGLESTAGRGGNDAAVKQELLERLRAEIAYVEHKTGVAVDPDAVQTLMAQAGDGLDRLLGEGPDAQLAPAAISGLEAVVRTDGSRPVLFVEDDFVDVMAPSIGDYAAGLSRVQDAVRQVCRAVGRVDDPSTSALPLGYQGTAWVVAEGLVATNYHVLQAIAPGGVRRDGRFEGRLNTGVAVHFGHEVGKARPERRFPIRRVVSVGRQGAAEFVHPDVGSLNFDGLDLAIMELEPVPGRAFPQPNRVARGDDPLTHGGLASTGRGIYVIGYPGNEHSTTPDLFAKLFANVKSYKRLSPGLITAAAGEVPQDPRGWVITYDASTLGGNSGSALVDLDGDGRTLLGLHFAGYHQRQNWAHALERITQELAPVLPTPVP